MSGGQFAAGEAMYAVNAPERRFPAKKDDAGEGDEGTGGSGGRQQQQLQRKPTENLSGGGKPNEEPEETDPAKLADAIPRS